MSGKKVLALDVDPQGDLTKMLGQRKLHELPLTLANSMNDVASGVMARDHPEIMHHHEGFDFVPENRSLSAVEVSLVNVMSRETVLRQYVDSVKQDYDYVLLDCRPSLGMLVINALAAFDYVLIPVQADYLATEDMTELVGTVQSIKRQINPRLKIGGVFPTMANETNFRKDIVTTVKENTCLRWNRNPRNGTAGGDQHSGQEHFPARTKGTGGGCLPQSNKGGAGDWRQTAQPDF